MIYKHRTQRKERQDKVIYTYQEHLVVLKEKSLSFIQWHINLCESFNVRKGYINCLIWVLLLFMMVFDYIWSDFSEKGWFD